MLYLCEILYYNGENGTVWNISFLNIPCTAKQVQNTPVSAFPFSCGETREFRLSFQQDFTSLIEYFHHLKFSHVCINSNEMQQF